MEETKIFGPLSPVVKPLNVVFVNQFGVDVVAFFSGIFVAHNEDPTIPIICSDPGCATPFDPNPECTTPLATYNAAAEFEGASDEAVLPATTGPKRTFYFKIPLGGSVSFYINAKKGFSSTATWVVPHAFAGHMHATVAKGPVQMSIFEMTNTDTTDTVEDGHVGFDISYLDGVSCQISAVLTPTTRVDWLRPGDQPPKEESRGDLSMIPNPNTDTNDPTPQWVFTNLAGGNFSANNPVSFFTVLSDKHTAPIDDGSSNAQLYDGLTSRMLAACPGGLVADTPMGIGNSGYVYTSDRASGMHLCRVWYYNHNREDLYDSVTNTPTDNYKRTYCNWLRKNKVDAFTWAYDELRCLGAECGYDDVLDQFQDRPHIKFDSTNVALLLANLDEWAVNYQDDANSSLDLNQSIAFSCGNQTRLIPPSQTYSELAGGVDGEGIYKFWNTPPAGNGFGCVSNDYVTRNPYAVVSWPIIDEPTHTASATLTVTFKKLAWLNPSPQIVVPGPGGEDGGGGSGPPPPSIDSGGNFITTLQPRANLYLEGAFKALAVGAAIVSVVSLYPIIVKPIATRFLSSSYAFIAPPPSSQIPARSIKPFVVAKPIVQSGTETTTKPNSAVYTKSLYE